MTIIPTISPSNPSIYGWLPPNPSHPFWNKTFNSKTSKLIISASCFQPCRPFRWSTPLFGIVAFRSCSLDNPYVRVWEVVRGLRSCCCGSRVGGLLGGRLLCSRRRRGERSTSWGGIWRVVWFGIRIRSCKSWNSGVDDGGFPVAPLRS